MPATERIRDHAGQGATTVAARRRRLRADRARQLADLLRRQILTGCFPTGTLPGRREPLYPLLPGSGTEASAPSTPSP